MRASPRLCHVRVLAAAGGPCCGPSWSDLTAASDMLPTTTPAFPPPPSPPPPLLRPPRPPRPRLPTRSKRRGSHESEVIRARSGCDHQEVGKPSGGDQEAIGRQSQSGSIYLPTLCAPRGAACPRHSHGPPPRRAGAPCALCGRRGAQRPRAQAACRRACEEASKSKVTQARAKSLTQEQSL